MKFANNWMWQPLLPLLLALLVSGCATNSPLPAPQTEPPRNPPLPMEARQPTPPEACLPTCKEGWLKLRTELSNLLTKAGLPGSGASGSTKP